MHKIRRSMYTETAHMLRGHLGLCQYYHGHSYKWTVEIAAERLQDDMVIDFADLKDLMNMVIGPYDHSLVVDTTTWNNTLSKVTDLDDSQIIIMSHRPTAERMVYDVYNRLYSLLPKGTKLLRVICRETENNEAEYSEE